MVAVISSLLDTKDDGLSRSWFSQAITALLVKETRKKIQIPDEGKTSYILSSESILTAEANSRKKHGRPSLVGPITSLRVEKWFDYYL